jgi:hypothetical protein
MKDKPAPTTKEIIGTLEKLKDILIGEFSYDGEDPRGVKAYQNQVDEAQDLIDRLTAIQPNPV